MIINKNDTIAGQRILLVRDLMRRIDQLNWYNWQLLEITMDILKINSKTAKKVIDSLEKEGYIEKKENKKGDYEWCATLKGRSLALASAAKPIKRSTADKKIKEVIERAKIINVDDHYLYRIKKMIVFGSYLSNKEKLGDIDIAIKIERKVEDNELHLKLTFERIRAAMENGRVFGNVIEQQNWPEEEVWRYLKSRSRSISLHSTKDLVLIDADYKVIFEE